MPLPTPSISPRHAAVLLLALGSAAAVAAPTTSLFDNLDQGGLGWYSGISATQSMAARIPTAATVFNVTEVTLSLRDGGSTTGLTVQVCGDGPGGTSPGTGCTPFTAQDPILPTMGNVRFSGLHAAAASSHVWVIARSSASSGFFAWETAPGTPQSYYSSNGGTSWSPDSTPVLLGIRGEAAAAPPQPVSALPVPTMGFPALLALSLGMVAACMGRARRGRRRTLENTRRVR
ncbi:MAG: hypothetical protein LBI66_03245 [Burkholderiaceae bacterium]|jgi:hypothetical protein|nr:hypothetical protein [Burkholderiaceae bacterium]